jgi:hypothetical protein
LPKLGGAFSVSLLYKLINDKYEARNERDTPEKRVFNAFTITVEKGFEPGGKGGCLLPSQVLDSIDDRR